MDGEEESTSSAPTTTIPTLSKIRVKTLADRECYIDIDLNNTVERFRELVHQHMGIAPNDQRIIFQGRVLSSSQTLASYGIEDGYTVHLVDRPPPGLPTAPSSSSSTPQNETPYTTAQARRVRVEQMLSGITRSPFTRSGVPQLTPRLHNLTLDQPTTSTNRSSRRATTLPQAGGIVKWKLYVEEQDHGFLRTDIELMVQRVISSTQYLSEHDRSRFHFQWENGNELHVRLPRIASHVASPAFERLSFVESSINYLRAFMDNVLEENGLHSLVQRILTSCDTLTPETTTDAENSTLLTRLREIAVRLESIHNVVPSNRNVEQMRLRTANYPQREARVERIIRPNVEPYFMRHAIDIDLTAVTREFRNQQRRFFELEATFEDMIEKSAITKIRERHPGFEDWRIIALSLFYTHMLRTRHHIAHMQHTITEIELPFQNVRGPQRLLPQYDTSRITVPRPHEGILIIVVRRPDEIQQVSERVSSVFTPPRTRTDIGNSLPGEWPYLTFYPTGMLQEAHEMQIPLVSVEMSVSLPNEDDTFPGVNILSQYPMETVLQMLNSEDDPLAPLRVLAQDAAEFPQIAQENTSSTLPSRAVDTQPPPGQPTVAPTVAPSAVPTEQQSTTQRRVIVQFANHTSPSQSAVPSSPVSGSTSSQPQAGSLPTWLTNTSTQPSSSSTVGSSRNFSGRGPETESIAPYPQRMNPTELHTIAKNIASRYRNEALLRIAANLTRIFQDQIPPWDTRLSSLPVSTLREILAIVLELLTSSRSADEAREMMLALVRDEEVLIRAISESMRAMFVQGTFPTHVNRLILPLQEYLHQRPPEPDVLSDETVEEILVRMPSDVSQPQSGSLRDLASARAERRRVLDERLRQQPSERRSPTPLVVGRSLRPQDEREAENILRPTSSPSSSNTSATEDVQMDTSSNHPNTNPNPIPSVTVSERQNAASLLGRDVEDTTGINEALQELFQNPPEVGMAAALASALANVARDRRPGATPQVPTRSRPTAQQVRNNLMHSRISTTPGSSSGEQRGARAQAEIPLSLENATTTNIRRQTVSIDPFLSCTSRHSEFNRLHQMPDANPEADRMTSLSTDPNPELTQFMSTLTIPQRVSENVGEDPEYTYLINRNESGELSFENSVEGRRQFERVLRTALRSFFGHLVETDAIIALNSLNVTGHPAPRAEILQDMVSRHLNHDEDSTRPFGTGSSGHPFSEFILSHFGQNAANADNVTIEMRQEASPNPTSSNSDDAREQELRRTGDHRLVHLSVSASLLHDYARNTPIANYPPGIWGLCLELLRDRLTDNDYANLIQRHRMVSVIGDLQNTIRLHLVENQMNGNARPTREDIQSISERLSADEDFFRRLLAVEPHSLPSLSIRISNQTYEAPAVLRLVEVDTIRQLIELVLRRVEPNVFAEGVWNILHRYGQRCVSVLGFLYENDPMAMQNYMNSSIPQFVVNMLSNGESASSSEENRLRDNWSNVMCLWHRLSSEAATTELRSFLESFTRSSPSPSTSSRESNRDPVEGETSAKRRRCDDSMETEEFDDKKDDGDEKEKKEDE